MGQFDPRFGEAKVGDTIKLKSPFIGGETIATLTEVATVGEEKAAIHTYDLTLFGVWFGTVKVKQTQQGPLWGVFA